MNSRLFKRAVSMISFLALLLFSPLAAFANVLTPSINSLTTVGSTGDLGGAASNSLLPTLIGSLISVVLGVVGIIFVVLIIQSGFEYMNSAGEEGKVKEAKKRIVSCVIGIVILLAAYGISSFVITSISNATGGSVAAPAAQSDIAPIDGAPSDFMQDSSPFLPAQPASQPQPIQSNPQPLPGKGNKILD